MGGFPGCFGVIGRGFCWFAIVFNGEVSLRLWSRLILVSRRFEHAQSPIVALFYWRVSICAFVRVSKWSFGWSFGWFCLFLKSGVVLSIFSISLGIFWDPPKPSFLQNYLEANPQRRRAFTTKHWKKTFNKNHKQKTHL